MDSGGGGAGLPGRGGMREQREGTQLRGSRRICDDPVPVGRSRERDDGSDPSYMHLYAKRQAGQPDLRRADGNPDGEQRRVVGRAAGNDRAFGEGEVKEQGTREQGSASLGLAELGSGRQGSKGAI